MIRLRTFGEDGRDFILDLSRPRDEIVSLLFPGIGIAPWDLWIGKGFYLTLIIPGQSLCERLREVMGGYLRTRRSGEDYFTGTYESPGNTDDIFRELREMGIRMKFRIGEKTYLIR